MTYFVADRVDDERLIIIMLFVEFIDETGEKAYPITSIVVPSGAHWINALFFDYVNTYPEYFLSGLLRKIDSFAFVGRTRRHSLMLIFRDCTGKRFAASAQMCVCAPQTQTREWELSSFDTIGGVESAGRFFPTASRSHCSTCNALPRFRTKSKTYKRRRRLVDDYHLPPLLDVKVRNRVNLRGVLLGIALVIVGSVLGAAVATYGWVITAILSAIGVIVAAYWPPQTTELEKTSAADVPIFLNIKPAIASKEETTEGRKEP